VIVNITFLIADSILLIAYLGFLGFGLTFPTASWGDMLGNAQQAVESGYWCSLSRWHLPRLGRYGLQLVGGRVA